jgi:hypothetical protein
VVFEWPNLVPSRTLYRECTITGGCLRAFCFGASLYIKSARFSGVQAAHLRHCAGISWVIYVNRTSPTPHQTNLILLPVTPRPKTKHPQLSKPSIEPPTTTVLSGFNAANCSCIARYSIGIGRGESGGLPQQQQVRNRSCIGKGGSGGLPQRPTSDQPLTSNPSLYTSLQARPFSRDSLAPRPSLSRISLASLSRPFCSPLSPLTFTSSQTHTTTHTHCALTRTHPHHSPTKPCCLMSIAPRQNTSP